MVNMRTTCKRNGATLVQETFHNAWYKVLGYEISLRRQEAEMIEVISEEEAKKLAEKTVYHELSLIHI